MTFIHQNKNMRLFSCTANHHHHHPRRRRRHLIFTHSELAAATSNFSSSSLLGRGSQSSVFLATFPKSSSSTSSSTPPLVAAAKLPSSSSELSILSSLPHSPFIVNLLGFTLPSPSIPLLELMPSGSLHHLLHSSQSPPPPWRRRLHLAFLSSLSLSFLHSLSPPIIHRDFKPSNILLDSSLNPRLSDFGLAVPFPSLPPPAGTLGYLDPSYTSPHLLTTKTDVFSFGVVLLELISGRRLHLAFLSSLSLSFLHSLSPHLLTTKTDVFSFGVVLLELISGRRAFDVDHSPPALSDWGLSMVTQRRFDEMCDARMGPVVMEEFAAVACLAARCVRNSPEDRPEMAEVTACLRRARSPPVVRWRKWMTWWGPV